MARKPVLHSVDELVGPAVERTVLAVGPPAEDDALVATIRLVASTLDRMSNDERARMAGQTVPGLLKLLQELERRRERRAEPQQSGKPNWLELQRESYARRHAPHA